MAYTRLAYDPWEILPEERKAMFVGRGVLIQQLLSAVVEQKGHATLQHYLLLGPRGIGKTTILLALRDRVHEDPVLSKHWFCVQLREEEYFIRTLRDLLDLTLQALADDENLPEAANLAQTVRKERDDERSLAVAVDGLRNISETRGKRILLLIDNFDKVFPATSTGRRKTRPPENEYRAFRKLLSTESFLMVIGASVRLFEEIAAYDQAFFNFFCPIEIPNFSDEEIWELLRKRAEVDANPEFLRRFEQIKDKVRAITYMTGGNPRLVLMLYDVLRHREMLPVVQALRETVGSLTPMLKHVLDDMPRQQSKTLDSLMRLGGVASPSSIARLARLPLNVVTAQLSRLKEQRFVIGEGEGKGNPATYRTSDPMFCAWYQMRYLRPAGRRVELFVEFLRAWFSIEDRRRFIGERWQQLRKCASSGAPELVSDVGLGIEYYAASLEDERERGMQLYRLAGGMFAAGRTREAARLLAEFAAPAAASEARYVSAGYRAVGDKLLDRNELARAIETYTEALRKDPSNAEARLGLGLSYGLSGDYHNALKEFDRVAQTPNLATEVLAAALINRGKSEGLLGDSQGETADYTAVVEMPTVSPHAVSNALYNRAVSKGRLGDTQGAIADYSAILQLPTVTPDMVAMALVNRAFCKGLLGDNQGAIGDYTAVVESPEAPVDQVAKALVNRGIVFGRKENHQKALGEIQAAMALAGLSEKQRYWVLLNRGFALARLGRIAEAIRDFEQCMKSKTEANTVHKAFDLLVRIHLQQGKLRNATNLMASLHEMELEGTPIEQRLEARLLAIVNAGKTHSLNAASTLLETALLHDPDDVHQRLAFVKPAIEFARTGSEQDLAGLPDNERESARQISAILLEKEEPLRQRGRSHG